MDRTKCMETSGVLLLVVILSLLIIITAPAQRSRTSRRPLPRLASSDRTACPGEVPTDSFNTPERDGVLAGSPTLVTRGQPHPPRPLGRWSFREARGRSASGLPSLEALPCPWAAGSSRGRRLGNCQAVSFHRDLCVAFPFYCFLPQRLAKAMCFLQILFACLGFFVSPS